MKPFTKNDFGWVAVYTHPGCEHDADVEIRRKLALWTFYPFSRVTKLRKQGRVSRVYQQDEPYFSRYIFARLIDKADATAINDLAYVSGVVKQPGQEDPVRVPVEVMDELMEKTDARGFAGKIDLTQRKRMKPGQRVMFDEGSPFAGLMAQVSIDAGEQVKVWLQILGAERELVVHPTTIKAA